VDITDEVIQGAEVSAPGDAVDMPEVRTKFEQCRRSLT
jgi:hypothetical protein